VDPNDRPGDPAHILYFRGSECLYCELLVDLQVGVENLQVVLDFREFVVTGEFIVMEDEIVALQNNRWV